MIFDKPRKALKVFWYEYHICDNLGNLLDHLFREVL